MSKTIEEIKDNYANEQGRDTWDEFFSWNELCHTGIDRMQYHHDQIAQRYAQSQTQELTAWKESASKVFKNLDLQAIGKTLSIGLGEDVSVNALQKIKELQEQNAELVEFIQDVKVQMSYLEEKHFKDLYKEAKELLTKYNHLKSNTDETDLNRGYPVI